jgi:disulfide oxidoreductase YuzD
LAGARIAKPFLTLNVSLLRVLISAICASCIDKPARREKLRRLTAIQRKLSKRK